MFFIKVKKGKNCHFNGLLVTKLNMIEANVFVATCSITEECPVPKNAQTNQCFGNF